MVVAGLGLQAVVWRPWPVLGYLYLSYLYSGNAK
jgi:hypothetical protein